jgi:hypothetical protein
MSTVFLSAPRTKTQQGSEFYRTFHGILANSVGPEYAIHEHLVAQIHSGDKAVGFDRDQRATRRRGGRRSPFNW